MAGATVVDRASVLTAHLAEVIRSHSAKLLSRQDVRFLVDAVRATHPVVADELAAVPVSLAEVQHVLQSLLEENVAIRDLVRILEILSERARSTKDPEQLVEAVRNALGPAISASLATEGRLPVITIDPLSERALLEQLRAGDGGTFLAANPVLLEQLTGEVRRLSVEAEQRNTFPALLCSSQLRPALRRLLKVPCPNVSVLAYNEVGRQLTIETMGVVRLAAHATL